MPFAARRQSDLATWNLATAIRTLSMDAVQAANSGHPGMPMGMADVATVLFRDHLKFDSGAPDWPDRDRFVLSAGHGSMLLYALLHLTGYDEMTLEQIKHFRQLGSLTAGHPEYGHAGGIETTTGPLGQGVSAAVGMAIAEERLRAEFGEAVCDHRTWVITGDGCLMEGISQESLSLAGHLKLGRLVVLWDDNKITIDGRISLSDSTDQARRFEAMGWRVLACDGHDPEDISRALAAAAQSDGRPTLVACRTTIGYGATKQDSAGVHGSPLGAEEILRVRSAYGWEHGDFHIPEDIREAWLAIGRRGAAAREAWAERIDALDPDLRDEFARRVSLEPAPGLSPAIAALKRQAVEARPKIATRKASEMVLEVVNPACPETMGGSADLTGSNNTLTADLGTFTDQNRAGRYIHYGIREHGMAAVMNGLTQHGGIRAYGGTFLCFSDYMRGALRLGALMGVPAVHVLTHDSIGLGEDGPTHQPVEHLAMLRATPNLWTFRPADLVETAEAWELALTTQDRPSVLALSRQNLPTVREEAGDENLTARGAYVLREAAGAEPRVVLLASGSEVEIALEARAALEADGIPTRVVSVPCMELFRAQPERYRREVLPAGTVRVAIEAAVRMPWDWLLLGEGGSEARAGFVGMEGFGASAPAPELYRHFGITAGRAAELARSLM